MLSVFNYLTIILYIYIYEKCIGGYRMKKITIIVPAYNASEYIEQCIENILKIPYNNIELIVVNDGSTDDTLKKISQYKNEKLIVVNQKNSGVSVARNKGLLKATGEYVTFFDVDDKISPELYGELFDSLDYNHQLYMFKYDIYENEKISDIELPLQPGKYDRKEILVLRNNLYDIKFSKNYSAKYFGGKVYQYLYSREFLLENNISFPAGIHFAEDCIFCFICFNFAQNLEIIDICPYHYMVYNDSASHKLRDNFFDELVDSFNVACKIAGEELANKNEIYYFYARETIRRIAVFGILNNKHKKSVGMIKNVIYNSELKIAIDNLNFSNWTKDEKLLLLLCKMKASVFIYLLYYIKMHVNMFK